MKHWFLSRCQHTHIITGRTHYRVAKDEHCLELRFSGAYLSLRSTTTGWSCEANIIIGLVTENGLEVGSDGIQHAGYSEVQSRSIVPGISNMIHSLILRTTGWNPSNNAV
ncbi:hypothetical protein ABKN59_011270 [Abortiporus biennis]